MSDLELDSVLLGLRARALESPLLANLPAHLMNTAHTETDGAYWQESFEVLEEDIIALGGKGNNTQQTSAEYIIALKCPKDEGTGRIWTISKEVAALCQAGYGVILADGQQATVMRCERLGPRPEDHEFVMRVRLDVLAFSRT